jgi:DNA-binding PadR family transcriptional regulator
LHVSPASNQIRARTIQYLSTTDIAPMTPRTTEPSRFLPLPPLDFQVLSVLATRELHGYAIVQAAAEALPGQPRLDVGSLYRIISRMLDERLIREVKPPRGGPSDNRVRRFYTATDLGRAVARAEALRLQALLTSAVTLRLLETEG